MFVRRFSWGLTPLLFLCSILPFAARSARADAFSRCKLATGTTEKIETCSIVIRQSRNPKVLERAYNRRGLAYEQANQFAAAADDFTAVIGLNPTIAGYFDNRQRALKALGRLPEALQDANVAVRLAPTYSFVYRSRGGVLDAMNRHRDAIADYNKGISIEPNDVGLYIDRGKTLAKLGLFHEAIKDLSHALGLDSKAVSAIRERGFVYKLLGDYPSAIEDLSLYVRLEPFDREAILALREMQESQTPPTTARRPKTGTHDQEIDRGRGDTSGSGFFVSLDGHIATNAHVIAGCHSVVVASGLSTVATAQVLARDAANDLALLQSDLRPNAAASLRRGVRVGENVAAFGFPLAGLLSTSGNFTLGNVSSVAGPRDDTRLLQITAPVQPGNSGGPLVDDSGNVVGVVVSKLDAIQLATITDDIAQNVNFAIKAIVLANFLETAGVEYSTKIKNQPMSRTDLAEHAKSIAAQVFCRR